MAKFHRRREAAESAKAFARTAETKKLERDVAATHGQINAVVRERILRGKDDEVFVSPELRTARMSHAEADSYNSEQAAIFVNATPEYAQYRSRENFAIIAQYLELNGLQIVDAEMLRHAFERLRDCGALHEREIEPVSTTPDTQPQTAIAEPEQPPKRTDRQQGWDLQTGEPKFYSNFEIERLSGDEFRRAFRLTKAQRTLSRRSW